MGFADRLRAELNQQPSAPQPSAPQPSTPISYAERLRQELPSATQAAANESPVSQASAEQAIQDADILKGAIGIDSDTVDAGIISLGRGLQRGFRGFKQLGLEAADAVGFDTGDSLAEMQSQEKEDQAIFDAHLGKTTTGNIGAFVGEVLPSLAVPLGSVARGASLLSKLGTGAVGGTIGGGTQFVDEGGSRAQNAALGAALGTGVAGTLAGAGRVAGKLTNTLTGKTANREAQDVLETGKQFDVPVSFADVTKSPIVRKVDTQLENIPVVGTTGFRQKQQDAARVAVEKLRNEFDPGEDIGGSIQKGLQHQTRRIEDKKTELYGRVSELADEAGTVPTSRMNAVAREAMFNEERFPDSTYIGTQQLSAFLRQFQDNPRLNFSDLLLLRGRLGNRIDDLMAGENRQAAFPLQEMKRALDDDLERFASGSGGELKRRWNVAQTFYKNKVIPQRATDIKKAAKSDTPDEVYSKFIKANLQGDRAQKLFLALDEPGRQSVRYGMIDQAYQKALRDQAGGEVFSPALFAQNLEKVQGSVGVFFRGSDAKQIDGLTKLMRHVQRAGQINENPPTGNRLVLLLTGAGAAVNPGAAASMVGTTALLRGLFTTTLGKRFLLASSRLEPQSTAMQKLIDRFSQKLPVLAGTGAE